MTMKKRIVSLFTAVAIIAAVVGVSANVANVADAVVGADAPIAIACNSGSSSGGGC